MFGVRETSGRAIDAVQLAYLVDNYPTRSWVASSRAESPTVADHAQLWSRGGVLLATTEQPGWFR